MEGRRGGAGVQRRSDAVYQEISVIELMAVWEIRELGRFNPKGYKVKVFFVSYVY